METAMNYAREMKKMKKHREGYRRVISRLLLLFNDTDAADFPVRITETGEMRLILELIDLGYLDDDALTVTRSFGDITGMAYNGGYPLTQAGDAFMREKPGPGIKEFFMKLIGRIRASRS
jgi:hypothetical protein